MKNFKTQASKLAVMIAIATPAVANAQGSHAGGGGFGFKLPNDSKILSSEYIERSAEMPANLSKFVFERELLEQLKTANQIAAAYGLSFLDDVTDPAKVVYEVVETEEDIPQYCLYRVPKLKKDAPAVWKLIQFACTVGNHTYFIKKNIEGLSYHNFAVILQHEGLKRVEKITLNPNVEGIIANYELAMDAILNYIVREQSDPKARMTDEEVKLAETMLNDMKELGFGKAVNDPFQEKRIVKIHPRGGGLYEVGAVIDPEAYVAMDSVVVAGSTLAEGSTYHGGSGKFKLGKNSLIDNVYGLSGGTYGFGDAPLVVGENSSLRNVVLLPSQKGTVIGDNTHLANLQIKRGNFGNGVSPENEGVNTMRAGIDPDLHRVNGNFITESVKIGNRVEIIDSMLTLTLARTNSMRSRVFPEQFIIHDGVQIRNFRDLEIKHAATVGNFAKNAGLYTAGLAVLPVTLFALDQTNLFLPHPPYRIEPLSIELSDLAIDGSGKVVKMQWSKPEYHIQIDGNASFYGNVKEIELKNEREWRWAR